MCRLIGDSAPHRSGCHIQSVLYYTSAVPQEQTCQFQHFFLHCREAECTLDPRVYEAFVTIAIDDEEKREANRKVWEGLAELYDYLRTPLPNPLIVAQREAKGEKAQDLAVAYVDAFVGAVGQDLVTLYMHHGMCHFPDMIKHVDLNISDMSQQWLEALLKQGKTDARLFSNNQLRSETMDKGRQAQILAKERERARLKKSNPMPLTRNEKRHLGGYELAKKAAKDKVDRAVRRGQLKDSRSKAQMNRKITKLEPSLGAIVGRFVQVRQQTAQANRASAREWASGGDAPRSASISVAGVSLNPGAAAGGGSGAGEAGTSAGSLAGGESALGAGVGAGPDAVAGAGAGAGAGTGIGTGAGAGVGAAGGTGGAVGSELLPLAGRGGRGAGRGRGRGPTGGGAGRTAMGRSAPKSARMRR